MSHLRIVHGNPTDEDVAVLVSVVAAASAAGGEAAPDNRPRELWGLPADRLRPADGIAPSAFPNLQYGY